MNRQVLPNFISYYPKIMQHPIFSKRNMICLEQNTSSFKYVGILFASTYKNN